jgi:hypothetical protein
VRIWTEAWNWVLFSLEVRCDPLLTFALGRAPYAGLSCRFESFPILALQGSAHVEAGAREHVRHSPRQEYDFGQSTRSTLLIRHDLFSSIWKGFIAFAAVALLDLGQGFRKLGGLG